MHFGYRRESSNTHTHTPYLPFSSFFPSSSTCTAVYYHCILLVTVRLCLLPSKHSLIEHTHIHTRRRRSRISFKTRLLLFFFCFFFFLLLLLSPRLCSNLEGTDAHTPTASRSVLPQFQRHSESEFLISTFFFFLCVCVIIPYKSRKRKKKWRLHRFQWSVRSTT